MGSSFVVYLGPSMLPGHEGETIRGVLTRESSNRKTGPMAQLWIVREDVAPHVASKLGTDGAVCGECPQRQSLGGGCYVTLIQGPRAMFVASTGKAIDLQGACDYLVAKAAGQSRGAVLRLGAYGDPAALPQEVVEALCFAVGGRVTGYTHQWREPTLEWSRSWCMASVETTRDAFLARMRGWRTFRVTAGDASLSAGEIVCVNESQGTSCQDCGLCNGAGPDTAPVSIAIPAHGTLTRRASKGCEQ
jgi:hypothetical protein